MKLTFSQGSKGCRTLNPKQLSHKKYCYFANKNPASVWRSFYHVSHIICKSLSLAKLKLASYMANTKPWGMHKCFTRFHFYYWSHKLNRLMYSLDMLMFGCLKLIIKFHFWTFASKSDFFFNTTVYMYVLCGIGKLHVCTDVSSSTANNFLFLFLLERTHIWLLHFVCPT